MHVHPALMLHGLLVHPLLLLSIVEAWHVSAALGQASGVLSGSAGCVLFFVPICATTAFF